MQQLVQRSERTSVNFNRNSELLHFVDINKKVCVKVKKNKSKITIDNINKSINDNGMRDIMDAARKKKSGAHTKKYKEKHKKKIDENYDE